MLIINNDINTEKDWLKNFEVTNNIIGILALQGINGINKLVFSRSLSSTIVLVAKTPKALPLVPSKSGTKLFPDNPIFLSGLSNIIDILVIYPRFSNKEKINIIIIICGKKDNILLIPWKRPSMIIPLNTIDIRKFRNKIIK